jgi:hypothetical protein
MKDLFKKINRNNFIKNHKKIIALFFCFVLFLVPFSYVSAQTVWTNISNGLGGAVALLLSWIALLITSILGLITTLFVKILVNVAQFNHIIDVQTVKIGWTTVRDICNMFFILILLVIAFGTILRIESYNAKKLLPKLLLMAVLINFSKTIFGLVIDFAQVIMLTFTNAFSNYGGWFIDKFNVKGVLTGNVQFNNATDSASGWANWALAVSIIAGVFASIITLIVVTVMLAILSIRIVMLWIYTILSPLFFLGMALPALQKYTNKIWEDFIKAVVTGPMLAFFIWLALTTATTSSDNLTANGNNLNDTSSSVTINGTSNDLCMNGGMSDFFCDKNLQNYIIFIGLMIGGLMVTQQIGGAAGSIAGKGMAKVTAAGGLGFAAGKMTADFLNRKQAKKTGVDLNPWRFSEKIKTNFNERKKLDLYKMEESASRNLKLGGIAGGITGITSHDWSENYLGLRGISKAVRGNKSTLNKKENMLREESEKNQGFDKKIEEDRVKLNSLNEHDNIKKERIEIKNELSQLTKDYSNPNIPNPEKEDMRIRADHLRKRDSELYEKDLEHSKNIGTESKDVIETRLTKNIEENEKTKIKSSKLKKDIYKYQVTDFKGRQVNRAAIAEEMKNVDSDDEDELLGIYDQAMARGKANLAAGIAKKLGKIGGFNSLLEQQGYQVRTGFNEDEAEKFKKEHGEKAYLDNRGFMDFMRDNFRDKLGMSEQNMLVLESDLGVIGEGNSHNYLRKTVGIKNGLLYQRTSDDAHRHETAESLKKESEKEVRNQNRLEYGSENINTKLFEWSNNGLVKFIARLDIIAKEIGANRFNDNAAAKITMSTPALEQLNSTLRNLVDKGVIASKGKNYESIDDFMKKLKDYGRNRQVGYDSKTIDEINKHVA